MVLVVVVVAAVVTVPVVMGVGMVPFLLIIAIICWFHQIVQISYSLWILLSTNISRKNTVTNF